MTDDQLYTVRQLVLRLKPEEIHHGDCVGADYQFHCICQPAGIKIVIHPPMNDYRRAFCKGDIVLVPNHFLDRNHDIVKATDHLIAAPNSMHEYTRSGTWATVRYARYKKKPITLVFPNGSSKRD